jgi:hypothetical protein
MRVLCCGPESSGTRLLSRIVNTGDGIEAIHRSIPHWYSWDLSEVGEIDRAVLMVRSWTPTIRSQVSRGLVPSDCVAIDHLRRAFVTFATTIDVPWWLVVYHNLIDHPDVVLGELSEFLGTAIRLPEDEELYDANRKWLGLRAERDVRTEDA